MSSFHKNAISRLSDLPEWNFILNHGGSPFCGPSDDDVLAVCRLPVADASGFSSVDWDAYRALKEKPHDVWLLTKTTDPVKITGMVSRLMPYKAFAVRSTYVCQPDVVQSIRESFTARVDQSAKRSESDEHALFDAIGRDAMLKGASDIHITLYEDRAEVALRIKGELRFDRDLPLERGRSLVTSAYNTLAEKGSTKEGFNDRAYQDAVIERVYPEGLVRFRYSGLPIAPAGTDITLRIIPIGVQSASAKSLASLGYSPDQCDLLERIFSRSSGLVLIAGTTGSGKSTTLATVLEDLARKNPEKKIRTIEEPVEYKIAGAFQTPVLRRDGEKDGVNPFALALRQIMRADPDIIMVGEIRDTDTAQLAVQGVRSGHLLVSTIHADGAPICFDRLSGLGVERVDLASVGLIAGLIYQKLVPILCDHCKVPYADWAASPLRDDRLLARINRVVPPEGLRHLAFRHTGGCPNCRHSGITKREVVAEILRPTAEMSPHIIAANSPDIWKMWRSTIKPGDPENMTGRTAFEHAVLKMRRGRVDPKSVEDAFRFLDEPIFGDVGEDAASCAVRGGPC